MQNDDQNLENQTLDKIENPTPKPKKRKFKLSFDLIIAIVLTLATLATIVLWYLSISKV